MARQIETSALVALIVILLTGSLHAELLVVDVSGTPSIQRGEGEALERIEILMEVGPGSALTLEEGDAVALLVDDRVRSLQGPGTFPYDSLAEPSGSLVLKPSIVSIISALASDVSSLMRLERKDLSDLGGLRDLGDPETMLVALERRMKRFSHQEPGNPPFDEALLEGTPASVARLVQARLLEKRQPDRSATALMEAYRENGTPRMLAVLLDFFDRNYPLGARLLLKGSSTGEPLELNQTNRLYNDERLSMELDAVTGLYVYLLHSSASGEWVPVPMDERNWNGEPLRRDFYLDDETGHWKLAIYVSATRDDFLSDFEESATASKDSLQEHIRQLMKGGESRGRGVDVLDDGAVLITSYHREVVVYEIEQRSP